MPRNCAFGSALRRIARIGLRRLVPRFEHGARPPVWPIGREGFRRVIAGAWTTLSLLGVGSPVAAHDVFREFIQHQCTVTVGARHIDVGIELTFFEEWSRRERARMDLDRDGRVTAQERRRYLKELRAELAQGIRLEVDGENVDLVVLMEPDLETVETEVNLPGHHTLRLAWFAATPVGLRSGSHIVLADQLWKAAPALNTGVAQGKDGIRVEAHPRDAGTQQVKLKAGGQRFEVKCSSGPVLAPRPTPSAKQISP